MIDQKLFIILLVFWRVYCTIHTTTDQVEKQQVFDRYSKVDTTCVTTSFIDMCRSLDLHRHLYAFENSTNKLDLSISMSGYLNNCQCLPFWKTFSLLDHVFEINISIVPCVSQIGAISVWLVSKLCAHTLALMPATILERETTFYTHREVGILLFF